MSDNINVEDYVESHMDDWDDYRLRVHKHQNHAILDDSWFGTWGTLTINHVKDMRSQLIHAHGSEEYQTFLELVPSMEVYNQERYVDDQGWILLESRAGPCYTLHGHWGGTYQDSMHDSMVRNGLIPAGDEDSNLAVGLSQLNI
jgi:hypothetical protein